MNNTTAGMYSKIVNPKKRQRSRNQEAAFVALLPPALSHPLDADGKLKLQNQARAFAGLPPLGHPNNVQLSENTNKHNDNEENSDELPKPTLESDDLVAEGVVTDL
mmetsp:Transcript_26674/g.32866  ORF Transcript_26674/g.32866 Transcript_26674/m.32866 type:complete len:106 (-) Transcript_26674:131-448(-)